MLKVRYVIKLDGELFYENEDFAEAYSMYKILRNAFVQGKLLGKPQSVILEKEVWGINTHKVEIITLAHSY